MRCRSKIITLAIAVLCGLAVSPPGAVGALITIEIEGVVDSVDDSFGYLEGNVNIGDTITGWYTYDSSVTRLPGERFHFNTPPCGVSLSVGGFDFQTDQSDIDFQMGIGNDLLWGDTYFFISFNNLSLSNGTLVDRISWSLEDATGLALSSDALPLTAPSLEDWRSENRLRMYRDRMWGIEAHVTSAIPEPSTILFLGIGAVLLKKRQ